MSDWDNEVDAASDALPPFAALIAALGDVDEPDDDEEDDAYAAARGRVIDVDRITLTLAIEMSVEPAEAGSLRVRGSTPTQWTETSVMPVFHKLTMHIAHSENSEQATDGEE